MGQAFWIVLVISNALKDFPSVPYGMGYFLINTLFLRHSRHKTAMVIVRDQGRGGYGCSGGGCLCGVLLLILEAVGFMWQGRCEAFRSDRAVGEIGSTSMTIVEILCLFLLWKLIYVAYIYCTLLLLPLHIYKIQHHVVESYQKFRKKAKHDAKAGIMPHNNNQDLVITNLWTFNLYLLKKILRSM